MHQLDAYLDEHRKAFEQDLCSLLSIASVSTDGRHQTEVRQAAQWLASQFAALGMQVEVAETQGNPIVLAETPPVPAAPTVLVYGHYDVQPADPLDAWVTPPFAPSVREGNVYARGATDDKGQLLTHIKSAQAWLQTAGRLPVNIKYLIEGEEEIGSASLAPFVAAHRHRLACDVAVISDTCQFGPGRPAITYGLRGIAYFELRLTGPQHDLHSGVFGGAVVNPATVLAKLLAGVTNEKGQVQVPHFYDDVEPLAPEERERFAALGFDEAAFQRQLGVSALGGEEGYTTLERRWVRPSFDVNGLWGGYQGEGAKTVLPARAGAKFSFRLVPRQDPAKIAAELEAWLRQRLPPGISMELQAHHGSQPVVVSLHSPYVQAAARAIERGFGTPPVFIREGGSIPVVSMFRELLGVDTLLLGWGLDDDHAHGPNEKFSLADFHRGIKASAYLWEELAALKP
ncbi:MAG: dipeptidase [Pirellulales bacterium]|nr:dipeptidase [Pirellulales bacterium]